MLRITVPRRDWLRVEGSTDEGVERGRALESEGEDVPVVHRIIIPSFKSGSIV